MAEDAGPWTIPRVLSEHGISGETPHEAERAISARLCTPLYAA